MIDFRLAFRSLAKTPLVTGIAIVSLSLGIGANAAIFSIFEQMVLRPLPVQEPNRLVNLKAPGPKSGSQSSNNAGGTDAVFSYPMFRDLQAVEGALQGIAAHRAFGANLAYQGNTLSGDGMYVSGNYFEVLGLVPSLGRLIADSDDQSPGAHPVVVLSHRYWQKRFSSDPAVLEDTLIINGQPLTIIGVAAKGFEGTSKGSRPQIFVPISMFAALTPGWDGFENRRNYWVYVFGRLQEGMSSQQAATALNMAYGNIIREVELPLQEGASEKTLERFRQKQVELEPGNRGQTVIRKMVATPLALLLGVSASVLLIACANLANLLLVKATSRASEIAVRMSIGAQRHQVVAQLLTESFLLAAIGSACGFLVAHGTLDIIASIMPTGADSLLSFEIGPMVWLFVAVLCVLTGLVGLFPALHCTRHDLSTVLKSQTGRNSGSRSANRFRSTMATFQIAMAMTLLISAGLFTKSLLNVSKVDLGIAVEQLSSFGLAPELNNYTPVESRNLFLRVEQELEALPGVNGVAASMVPLISGNNWGSNVSVEGFVDGPDVNTHSSYNAVGPDFFRTLGIPLLAGREFEDGDVLEAPKVAIVNETFARKFGLDRQAVGKRMQVGSGGENDITIVGLVQDSKYSEVKQQTPPLFYLPYRQDDQLGALSFYVRSKGDPEPLLGTIRTIASSLDPNLPVEIRTMEVQVQDNIFLDRLLSTLSAAFAVLATLLAAIGLYGVLAYSVAQRTREIGLRMALGADRGRVRRLIMRQVGLMTLIGGSLGLIAATGIGRYVNSLLYGLEGSDPWVFALAAVGLSVVALGAGLLPALRASSIEPMVALRDE